MIWKPRIDQGERPRYQAIVSALAADLRAGRLRGGDRLPAQRSLALALGVNLTTVMRAIAEARRLGLVVGLHGRGTFVQSARRGLATGELADSVLIDLTSNLPPEDWADRDRGRPGLAKRLVAEVAELGRGQAARGWLRYAPRGGSPADRHAGQAWLARRGVQMDVERVVVTGGADHALFLALLALTQPGDTILTEDLTYPGLRAMAAMLGRSVAPVRSDTHGLDPDDVRTVCRARKPVLLFCTPTLQNPTTAILSPSRRKALASVAQEHGLVILEDDVYGALVGTGPAPIATLAPDLTVYLTSLSKCLAPGLRVGYVATASDALAAKLSAIARATTWSPPALTSTVAARWIQDGTADSALTVIRREIETRHGFAVRALVGYRLQSHPAAPHLWLSLPRGWSRAAFVERARGNGVAVLASDVFATTTAAPEAVRVCLGAASDAQEARRAAMILAMTLRQTGLGPDVV